MLMFRLFSLYTVPSIGLKKILLYPAILGLEIAVQTSISAVILATYDVIWGRNVRHRTKGSTDLPDKSISRSHRRFGPWGGGWVRAIVNCDTRCPEL